MMMCGRAPWIAALQVIAAPAARGQSPAPLKTPDAKPFLGVWVIEMTEPAAFKGTHTTRVWDNGGTIAASHQAKPHPMQENGLPIWAVVSAVVDGDAMKVAQMLERSQTIKRGAGKRQN